MKSRPKMQHLIVWDIPNRENINTDGWGMAYAQLFTDRFINSVECLKSFGISVAFGDSSLSKLYGFTLNLALRC